MTPAISIQQHQALLQKAADATLWMQATAAAVFDECDLAQAASSGDTTRVLN